MTRTHAGQFTGKDADATAPVGPELLKSSSEVAAASPARGEPPNLRQIAEDAALHRAYEAWRSRAGTPRDARQTWDAFVAGVAACRAVASPPVGAPAVPVGCDCDCATHPEGGCSCGCDCRDASVPAAEILRLAEELEGYRCPEHTHYHEGRQDQALEDARRLRALSRSRGAR